MELFYPSDAILSMELKDMPATRDLFGILHRPDNPPRTIEEIREGMIESLVEDDERIKRGGSALGIPHEPAMRPATVKEMDNAVGLHLAEDDERIQKGGKGWA